MSINHPRSLRFSKMHGLGNDFVVIEDLDNSLKLSTRDIQFLSDRHLGIGCDQVLLIQPSSHDVANFACRIYNPDGSEAEQCGNGLRCVARYLYDKKFVGTRSFSLETVAGVFPVVIQQNNLIQVCITLEKPEINPITVNDTSPTLYALSIGNPHAILFTESIPEETSILNFAMTIKKHPDFSNGVNLGFAHCIDQNRIHLKTHERGAGITKACGSNACAAAIVGVETSQLANPVEVIFQYGRLTITWDKQTRQVTMMGPATSVFDGEVFFET